MSESHIYIYSQIGQGGVTAESIRKKLNNSFENVIVHINSPGGEVYEGYTIYNILRNSGKKITVVIEGLCASIATLIACAGDRIKMSPTAEFMIHNPMVGIEGDSDDLRKVADQLDNIKKTIIAAYKKKTNKSEEELWKMMDKETFLSASQAKDFGFVDEIDEPLKMVAYLDITKLKSEKTMEQKVLEALEAFGKKFDSIFSKKPKNLDLTLEDGTGIFVETEDENLVGKACFIVTPEGNKPAPDGNHMLADGRTIQVKGGKIEAVQEPQANQDTKPEEDEEKEKMKKEIEDLKALLAAKDELIANNKKESEAIKAESEQLKTEVEGMKKEFENIRNIALGGGAPAKKIVPQSGITVGYFENVVKTIKNKYN
jgi:ATP-dependent Clp endopeptidase proteolytic subunit ClpP